MRASSRAVTATAVRKLMMTNARPTHLEDRMYQTRSTTIAERSCEQITISLQGLPMELPRSIIVEKYVVNNVTRRRLVQLSALMRQVIRSICGVPLRESSVDIALGILRTYFCGQVDKRR